MNYELVVTEMFGLDCKDYQRGEVIADPAIIAVVEKEYARHLVRRAVPDATPAEQPKAE